MPDGETAPDVETLESSPGRDLALEPGVAGSVNSMSPPRPSIAVALRSRVPLRWTHPCPWNTVCQVCRSKPAPEAPPQLYRVLIGQYPADSKRKARVTSNSA